MGGRFQSDSWFPVCSYSSEEEGEAEATPAHPAGSDKNKLSSHTQPWISYVSTKRAPSLTPSYHLRSLEAFTSLPWLLTRRNHQISHFSVRTAQIVHANHEKTKKKRKVAQNGAEASVPKVFSVPRETLVSGSV